MYGREGDSSPHEALKKRKLRDSKACLHSRKFAELFPGKLMAVKDRSDPVQPTHFHSGASCQSKKSKAERVENEDPKICKSSVTTTINSNPVTAKVICPSNLGKQADMKQKSCCNDEGYVKVPDIHSKAVSHKGKLVERQEKPTLNNHLECDTEKEPSNSRQRNTFDNDICKDPLTTSPTNMDIYKSLTPQEFYWLTPKFTPKRKRRRNWFQKLFRCHKSETVPMEEIILSKYEKSPKLSPQSSPKRRRRSNGGVVRNLAPDFPKPGAPGLKDLCADSRVSEAEGHEKSKERNLVERPSSDTPKRIHLPVYVSYSNLSSSSQHSLLDMKTNSLERPLRSSLLAGPCNSFDSPDRQTFGSGVPQDQRPEERDSEQVRQYLVSYV